MIRAGLAILALAGPVSAATQADCVALLGRLGLEAKTVTAPSESCFYRGVTYGTGAARWRADILALFGDADALPDALPSRLTGGFVGLTPSPDPADMQDGETGPSDAVPMTVTFNIAAGGGTMRVDAASLRMGEAGRADLTATLSGLPQVWPAEPAAMARVRVQALHLTVDTDGMIEALLRLLPQTTDGDGTSFDAARAWLDTFGAGNDQAGNAAAAQALLAAFPKPRGALDLKLDGSGIAAIELVRLFDGFGLAPAVASRIAQDAGLEIIWTRDAP